MAKRVSLPDVVISAPKAVFKPAKEEALACILPKYYKSMADVSIKTNSVIDKCWFCNQDLVFKPISIETYKGGEVGYFCSKICRDSLASMVKSHVALREEPKISLLPLVFYEDKEKVINTINLLRDKDGVYGSCYFKENSQIIDISLRSLL
ncbi:V132; CPXV-BR_135 V132 [Cowpox virus]|uniref:Viral late gene transcription factor 2 n=2 Tax=Orthopoxvirus TaxID=10242 RepID=Q0NPV7_COWPX|nr:putative A1L protein [Orthopoxvirus Abatino]ABD97470.1 late gene transcription factor VLTF-2 [Cowpox virus]ADZ29454.1 late gene transcription factor VLTF-2 protein [Cowpox virus]ADZ29882.1 late gene transcription factor VLTF-2 protein [Cowpox virus]AGY98901.1 CPXV132 protein [Cowpox virus]AYN64685.1 putative A1L protein [Orthopoxvirus Abatino]